MINTLFLSLVTLLRELKLKILIVKNCFFYQNLVIITLQNNKKLAISLRSVRGIAQPGSASGLGPEGREFESLCPDHEYYCRKQPCKTGILNTKKSLLNLLPNL